MYGMMAEAYRRRGNIFMALIYFENSKNVTDLTNYPNTAVCRNDKYVSYSNLASLFKHNGDLDKAIVLYEKMTEMNTNDKEETAKAIKGTGDCFFGIGNYEEALQRFVKANKMIIQTNKTIKVRFNVSIGNTLVALRFYKAAIVAFSGIADSKMNRKPFNQCFGELDYLTGMHTGVATWVYYRELKQSINTEQTKNEAKAQKELFAQMLTSATRSLDKMLKMITEDTADFDKNELISCLTLSYAYILYDNSNKKMALQMLQKCLDTEILISVKSCKFCEQVKDNGVDMLKCSFCNVTRFCNKVCQKGAYSKRPNLKMAITLSHASLCPLLKSWKQVKKGNATVESCVEQQLLFLQTCDPLRKILDKNDFVDMD
jgi:tetratricopeptide (TPR) repeat protein